jgi:hypothetical protein
MSLKLEILHRFTSTHILHGMTPDAYTFLKHAKWVSIKMSKLRRSSTNPSGGKSKEFYKDNLSK